MEGITIKKKAKTEMNKLEVGKISETLSNRKREMEGVNRAIVLLNNCNNCQVTLKIENNREKETIWWKIWQQIIKLIGLLFQIK